MHCIYLINNLRKQTPNINMEILILRPIDKWDKFHLIKFIAYCKRDSKPRDCQLHLFKYTARNNHLRPFGNHLTMVKHRNIAYMTAFHCALDDTALISLSINFRLSFRRYLKFSAYWTKYHLSITHHLPNRWNWASQYDQTTH